MYKETLLFNKLQCIKYFCIRKSIYISKGKALNYCIKSNCTAIRLHNSNFKNGAKTL
jgi:hypothetical protein